MVPVSKWPKGPYIWEEDRTAYVSVPFTWNLPDVADMIRQGRLGVSRWVVGGPAVQLLPGYLEGLAEIRVNSPGILQRVNPQATKSTTGCPRACSFCGVSRIEPGGFQELQDWPDLPLYTDNNILASSRAHFDQVIDRAKKHPWTDFNQGMDARLLTQYHACRLAECNILIRLAWDRVEEEPVIRRAWNRLRNAGISKRHIRFYVLIGYHDTPADALYRLRTIRDDLKAIPNPMRFVPLDSLTPHYAAPPWTHRELMRFMRYWYAPRIWSVPFEDFRGRNG